MKALVLSIMVLVSPVFALGQATHVQTHWTWNSGTTAGTTSAAISQTNSLAGSTAGNLIVVHISYSGQAKTVLSVSDTKNTYAKINGSTNWGAAGTLFRSELWYAYNITGGAITVTVTMTGAAPMTTSGGNQFIQIYVSEFSGIVSASDPLDQKNVTAGNGSSPLSSGSGTVIYTNELIYGAAIGGTMGAISADVGAGFTSVNSSASNQIEYKNVIASGTYNASFTSGSSGTYVAEMATFKTTGSAAAYTWNGSSSTNWQTAANWTPTRTSPASSDFLTFNASGSNKGITNVPSQTVGNILVTGSSVYSFTPASSGNTLTLSNTTTLNAFQIDNGSTLTLGGSSNVLNLTMPSGGTAQIGGILSLNFSIFNVSSATLLLHTSSSPLAAANGSKITTNGSTVLQFGTTGLTSGTITLPNSIFNGGAPSILSLVMNTTSATLGNEPITVSSATFTSGILNTSSAGRIKFSSTATNPAESATSYISGYADMNSRSVGVAALTFLGFSMSAGSDVGNMTITRRTGSVGINTFPPSSNGIASTWDITSSTVPAVARTFSFIWLSAFDNTNVATNKFQTYINTGSGFNTLGALQNLASQGPPRQSATVSTTTLTASFTLADQNNALPITLLYFTAKPELSYVSLTWGTAAELNNDYFTVLHSFKGDDFKPTGTVKGNGTTNSPHDYALKDFKPVVGKNYYQLKQTDFDGKSITSETIVVDVISLDPLAAIYPNPLSSNQSLNIALSGLLKDGSAEIQIVNMQGTKVKEETTNIDSEGSLNASIALTGLSSGLYILKIQNLHFKFIIE